MPVEASAKSRRVRGAGKSVVVNAPEACQDMDEWRIFPRNGQGYFRTDHQMKRPPIRLIWKDIMSIHIRDGTEPAK